MYLLTYVFLSRVTRHFLERHYPLQHFSELHLGLGLGLGVTLGLGLWFEIGIMGIVITTIVLPGIAVPGIVRELFSKDLASQIIFISFVLKF